jgi:hypothetical protein
MPAGKHIAGFIVTTAGFWWKGTGVKDVLSGKAA